MDRINYQGEMTYNCMSYKHFAEIWCPHCEDEDYYGWNCDSETDLECDYCGEWFTVKPNTSWGVERQ